MYNQAERVREMTKRLLILIMALAEKSYLSNAMQHWRFYYGYQNGKWEKTKVEFYRDTEKRFMSDKITTTEYGIFANR